MSTPQSLKLVRFVKALIDLIFGLLVFGAILLAIGAVLAPVLLGSFDFPLTASVPVAIGTGEDPRIELVVAGSALQGVRAAFVNEAQGILRLETTNWVFVSISYLAQFLTVTGFAYVFYSLRAVLQAILEGKTFTVQNTTHIRRIGYFVLALGFLRPAVDYLASREILSRLTLIEPAVELPAPFQVEAVLTSLLILVLAQVWSYGLDLEREHALTI